MSRQNWLCLEPTCDSSYKSHTAEWHLKNWILILLSGRALPALSRVWGRSRSWGLPKCAKLHLCQQHRAAVTLARRGGQAVLSLWRPATWSLCWWQVASDNGVIKEVSQSQVGREQGIIVEQLGTLYHTKKCGRTSVFPRRRAMTKTAKNCCWGRVPCLT